MGQRPPVKIFGTDYPTQDGTAIRDYIHVQDLASAHLLGVNYLMAGGASTAVNLGAGTGVSVLEVLQAVENVSGKPVPSERFGRRAGDPPALVAQAGLAKEVIGWSPQHSSIENIVRDAWGWSEKAIRTGIYAE
ncbi:NAD-dependent epimerase/dehydratase family protein [Bryobacter aggregatus]|uniref:NAD-dependent epimerase/dehydratase family protein n=1 Tax=Bryobacter aggregatus TaxID=360054 RepID=UPI000ABFE302|nr:NAD-dependent epimerase/dehydratase family protein [Bryobacter aggregatus]